MRRIKCSEGKLTVLCVIDNAICQVAFQTKKSKACLICTIECQQVKKTDEFPTVR